MWGSIRRVYWESSDPVSTVSQRTLHNYSELSAQQSILFTEINAYASVLYSVLLHKKKKPHVSAQDF